ncbi:MAG: M55 family metallopeptidase [Gemmatimonadota bacterium]
MRRMEIGGWAPTGLLAALGTVACLAMSPGSARAQVASAESGLRVYISADMEGVVGTVTGDQLGPSGFEYQRFREIMTREVNAAIEAARRAGVTEILVSDSHGNGENLLMELLPQDIQLIRSWPRPLGMMEGIDESFDAVIFIGYHASTANPRGVRAHTLSSANLTGLKLNGVEHPEAGLNAAIAGHFGVPVVMISGDDAIVEEARGLLGDVEGAVTKWSLGFHSARTVMPEESYRRIGAAVTRALARRDTFRPYRLEYPVTLELSFKNYLPAEVLAFLPGVERADSHSIRFLGKDILEISRFLRVATGYRPDLRP